VTTNSLKNKLVEYASLTKQAQDTFKALANVDELGVSDAINRMNEASFQHHLEKSRNEAILLIVLDDIAGFLKKRKIEDALTSPDFIEFADVSSEYRGFQGDIFKELQNPKSIERIKKFTLKARFDALSAQSEREKDIPAFRIEFIRGDMRSENEIDQLDRIELLNQDTGVKK
jgi:hypothetical protein